MLKKIGYFLLGIIVACICMFAYGVYADNLGIQFNKIKVVIGNNEIQSDNILYNGRTYIQLREVSESLGNEVQWDSKTNTAKIIPSGYTDLNFVGVFENDDEEFRMVGFLKDNTVDGIYIDMKSLNKAGYGFKVRDENNNVDIFKYSEEETPYPYREKYNIEFPLKLYSDDGKNVYLGKLVTNEYDSEGIFNSYGTYGSKYSDKSIWNEYSQYGNEYSNYSAFNKLAINPPVIKDSKGNILYRLTTNSSFENCINPFEVKTFLLNMKQ